jgi:DNA-binding NarL/FixJ family response regulator
MANGSESTVSKKKVLIADDHPLMATGIRRVLEEAGEFEIVGEAHLGNEVLPLVARTEPDVVLLDLHITGIDPLGLLERLRVRFPAVKVVTLSTSSNPERIQAALARGASGYIVKTIQPRDLAAAIRQAIHGTVYHAIGMPEMSETAVAKTAGLTERELTIVKAVARGLSNQAIAKELWVTEQTVKFHLTNIYRKLGTANRTEAARWAYEHGLAELPEGRRPG